jgi:hypothetical protein
VQPLKLYLELLDIVQEAMSLYPHFRHQFFLFYFMTVRAIEDIYLNATLGSHATMDACLSCHEYRRT